MRGSGGYQPAKKARRPDQPAYPVLDYRGEPKACIQSRRHGSSACSVCGARGGVLHVPTKVAGVFCAEHCPVCSSGRRQKPKPKGSDEIPPS